ncbi:hypothetical protein DEU56DRAFT_918222 [Suillus clintonianus]|uniref:uncharacterized protein n=1 Tax=Suillus clintonianus TaxID=1904413 RepID=UPI001B8670DE|nr:uncharacterized protein DEU56DRAFT_918222 [Suillus clintonianus]KAG2121293.1 hypothetical protein DEU56DRAFT_918222 [Suillus clintonianus]
MALDSAWNELDKTVKTIVSSHHKSFRRDQNDLCMGRGILCYQCSNLNAWNTFCWKKRHEDKENGAMGKTVLQELVSDENRAEYRNLAKDKKVQLLQEYSEHKETKTTGICISIKLKVNDMTQTLKAVENEASAEIIIYVTHGSTDLPLCGVAFATEGVDEFMGSMMNINNQDLMSKMEGFAIQGAARNHKKLTSDVRSAIHREINRTLCEFFDPSVRMHWANYWWSVVQRYLVVIEAPYLIWKLVKSVGGTWKKKVNSGDIVDKCRRTRSDKGKKCGASNNSGHCRKAYKSNATVVSNDELDSPCEDTPPVNTTPSGHTTTLELTSSTPSTIPNPPSTSPAIPNSLSPELTSTAGGLGQFINNNAVSMSSILPAGSIGASPSMSLGSSEFNFNKALANLDQDYGSVLDFMNC